MLQLTDRSRRARWFPVGLTVALGLATSLLAYLSLPGPAQPGVPIAEVAAHGADSPVHEIVLLHDEPEIPSGPHRDTFASRCTSCHSPRLVANQPLFPREKWSEVVHKMVTAYGAPVSPAQEPEIVDYLMTFRGR
jgi:hypothetical protein